LPPEQAGWFPQKSARLELRLLTQFDVRVVQQFDSDVIKSPRLQIVASFQPFTIDENFLRSGHSEPRLQNQIYQYAA
jgi:hypothetical protein